MGAGIEKFLSVAQAANKLQVTPGRVRQLLKDRRVIALAEDDPETCVGDSSGGAAIPTVIAAGRKTIRIKCDHRAINPGPMVAWADRFINQLSKGGTIDEKEADRISYCSS